MEQRSSLGVRLLAIAWVVGVVGTWVPPIALALQAGPRSPGACTNQFLSGASVGWSLPNNARTSDDLYASATFSATGDGSYTSWLFCSQFGFSLPSNATIEGIQVDIERRQSVSGATGRDKSVKIGLGSAQSAERASVDNWPWSDGVKTYGGSSDLWGLTWSPTGINANTFGVAITGMQVGGELRRPCRSTPSR